MKWLTKGSSKRPCYDSQKDIEDISNVITDICSVLATNKLSIFFWKNDILYEK